MNTIIHADRSWSDVPFEEESALEGDTPAWGVSLLVHVVVLFSLAAVGIGDPLPPQRAIAIVQPPAVDEDVLLAPAELTASDAPQDMVGASSDAGSEVAQALAPVIDEQSQVPVEASEDVVGDIQVEPLDVIPTGSQIVENVVVKGASGVGTTGASGAVDRLTLEISASLEERPTMVCWIFDQSVSLSGQRKEIAARLGRVFTELNGEGSSARQHELTNLVFAYGRRVTPVVESPTRDLASVVGAISSIPVDESGMEMTFSAIKAAGMQVKRVRSGAERQNVMLVVFTDEVGNDQQIADEVANFCRTNGLRVYVVGVPAPFGRQQVAIKFVEFDPKYASDVQWAVVDQGPETLYPEVVIVQSGSPVDEPIDSGFGPFSLSKLCAATGGIYFCVHANREAPGRVDDAATAPMSSRLRRFVDTKVMRPYQPDYLSAAKIDAMLAKNRAMHALVDAARSSQVKPMESPRMRFPREDDGKLAQILGEAQKMAALLQPRIDILYNTLNAGLPDRPKVTEKRWQAGYDLALGRVAAVKVRTDAYNIMLAQAKSGMKFKDPKHDTWELVPADDLSATGSQTEKLAKQATELLRKVVADHPGTPWALQAEQELRTPLGYRWTELTTGVNAKKPGGGGGGNAPKRDDQAKMLAPPKPKRELKNL